MPSSFAGTDFSIPAKPAELESASSGWSVDALVDVASAGVEDLLKQAAERVADDAGALAEYIERCHSRGGWKRAMAAVAAEKTAAKSKV